MKPEPNSSDELERLAARIADDEPVSWPAGAPGDQALHELFREQAAAVLDDADIGEEEKQSILLAMNCPCCGAGSMSFSVKMKPRARGKFVAEES